jgi:putative PIN family toxin of toxin-antitoxin system
LRLVFDTNVYVSAFVIPGSRSDLAFRLALRGAFELVVSREILAELRRKPASKFDFEETELNRVERTSLGVAVLVEPGIQLGVLRDEPDNRILECAVVAGASAIVTGDRHLLRLRTYEGIGIMTVSELLFAFPEIP